MSFLTSEPDMGCNKPSQSLADSAKLSIQVFQTTHAQQKQGSHSTGKTGNMMKSNSRQGKRREFENFGKTQGKHWEFENLFDRMLKYAQKN